MPHLSSLDPGALLITLALALSGVLGLLGWWSRWALASLSSGQIGRHAGLLAVPLTWLDQLGELVLTKHAVQRQHCLHFLIGVVACLTGLSALQFGAQVGIVDAFEANWLTGTALLACAGLYVRVRGHWGRELAARELVSWQLWACMMFLAWGYVIGGEGRPVALMLLLLMLSYNVFLADPVLMRRISLWAAGLFSLAMLRVALNDEGGNGLGPMLQLAYFVVLMLMLLSLTVMITHLDVLRRKSRERKQALEEALQRIGELATRDDLTGLFNRRHMLEWLHTERQRCQRQGRSFCIGLIDLDHFKDVNDRHGHAIGDEALTLTARTLARGLRETDLVARWGGEEFLVVFTDTSCADAQAVLDRIRTDLGRSMVSTSVPDLSLSFSAGLSTFQPDETLTRAMDRADRALYLAKAAGRGRTLVVEDTRPTSPLTGTGAGTSRQPAYRTGLGAA